MEDNQKLTQLVKAYTPHDGRFNLVENVHVVRDSKISEVLTYTLSQPGICLVPQGAKEVCLIHKSFVYGKSDIVVYSAEVPINVRVTEASEDKPFFCLVIPLDPQKLNELIFKVFPNGVPKVSDAQAVYVGKSDPKIVQSAIRLMETINQQDDTDLLVPHIIDEILIRLLRSPAGATIAQIGIQDSNTQKIAKAISWLKDNYTQPVKIEELAEIAGMSASPFYTHFKAITSMTPLQFQKTLRLQEARNLLRTKMMDVGSAAFTVGYASQNQFSREYSRFFGNAPSKDVGTGWRNGNNNFS